MRPARGKLAAAVVKSKTCVVRIEKFAQSRDESAEDDRKKMTGPLKKRPVVLKKQPAVVNKTRKRVVEEDLSEYMLVTARARRTPKPNPKYSNDDVVSPWNKSKEEMEESEDDEEQVAFHSSDPDEVPEEDSEEEFEPRPTTRNISRAIEHGEISRRGRPTKMKSEEQTATPKSAQKRKNEIDSESKALESLLAQNKRLNIELYDATDSDASMVSPGRVGARGGLRQSRLSLKPQKQTPKKFPERRRGRGRPRKVTSDEDEYDPDDFETTTGVASTIDDFETMPTFTIVNINDIINKKGDVLIQKTSQRNSGGGVGPRSESNNKSSDRDDDPRISPNQSSRNRRKTMHTTILSDKIDPDKLKTPPPRTPFPPRKPIVPNYAMLRNNNNNLSKSLLNSNQFYKTAPRILNSVLARKNKAVQEQQEQKQQKRQQAMQQMQKAESQQPQQQKPEQHQIQSKENHQLNNIRAASTAAAAAAASVPTPTSATTTTANRKLPSEKVLIQRQGNKIIKKITCFETWYVINIPPAENYTPKLQFDMTLMRLGNTIKDVCLPSADWNYKITLQKLTAIQMTKIDEIYTGEVQDSNIEPSEKFKYHPINVMFRRTTHNDKLRMPYDRAVIFKNKTYFTNIDGKNVRLIGAPHTINSLADVEILLQIVDEMTLISPFVEQTAYIL